MHTGSIGCVGSTWWTISLLSAFTPKLSIATPCSGGTLRLFTLDPYKRIWKFHLHFVLSFCVHLSLLVSWRRVSGKLVVSHHCYSQSQQPEHPISRAVPGIWLIQSVKLCHVISPTPENKPWMLSRCIIREYMHNLLLPKI